MESVQAKILLRHLHSEYEHAFFFLLLKKRRTDIFLHKKLLDSLAYILFHKIRFCRVTADNISKKLLRTGSAYYDAS